MSMWRPNWLAVLALLCCAGLALAPSFADARAANSFGSRPSSYGNRGWRNYDNNGAQPLWSQSGSQSGRGFPSGMSGRGGSFFQRHPFLTGLAGGAFGAWLFGHGGGFGLGTGLLRLLLFGLVIWFIVWLVRRLMWATGPPGGASLPMPRSAGAAAVLAPPGRGQDVNFSDADLNAFQRLHAAVQTAWSDADLARLRRLMTPEMLRWFSEELSRNASRGVRNIVSDVRLLSGELTEGWDEGEQQYATALLRWRALDYVVALGRSPGDADFVAGGDPRRPIEAEEMWTFVRRRGGPWLLSAIQQV